MGRRLGGCVGAEPSGRRGHHQDGGQEEHEYDEQRQQFAPR